VAGGADEGPAGGVLGIEGVDCPDVGAMPCVGGLLLAVADEDDRGLFGSNNSVDFGGRLSTSYIGEFAECCGGNPNGAITP
jgi:hypothetical protein